MEIRYDDHRILSEHKIDARPTDYQTLGYPSWKRDALVLIARAADIARYDSGGYSKCISWLDVALAMDRIANENAGPGWRTAALDPDAPSRLRVLLETLSFIERQNVGVCPLHPMNADDIDSYKRIRDTRFKMHTFLQIVHDHPAIKQLGTYSIKGEPDDSWWFPVDTRWPYLEDAHPDHGAEIALQPADAWLSTEEQRDAPLLYAGFYFETLTGLIPEAMIKLDSPVATALRDAEAHVGLHPNRRQVKCAATLYLSDALRNGETLEHQAAAAAIWAATAINTISQIVA